MDWRVAMIHAHHCTHHRTRKLLCVVDCGRDPGIERSRMMTGPELARRSRISRGHLYHIENESFTPSLRTLKRFLLVGCWLEAAPTLNSSEIVLEDSLSERLGRSALLEFSTSRTSLANVGSGS